MDSFSKMGRMKDTFVCNKEAVNKLNQSDV